MCRLLGLIANKPVDFKFSLKEGPKTLADMSEQNPHGWGLGWYQPDGLPKVAKEPRKARDNEQFCRTAAEGFSHIFIAHVRFASVGGVSVENCHPFQSDKWLFAHNGTIRRADCESLRRRLNPNRQDAIRGQTDSEVFFHWLLQNIESSDSVVEGLRKAIHTISDYSALNFLLSDGDVLYAYRDAKQKGDYTLYWVARPPEQAGAFVAESKLKTMLESKALRGERAVLVCSEMLTEEPWNEIPTGHLLVVDKSLSPKYSKVR
jgi:glutamine amidotransferase